MKRLNHQIALYLACCIETNDDGRRDLVTIRLLTLTWLFAALTSLLAHTPDLHPQRLTSNLIILIALALLEVTLLGRILTPYGTLKNPVNPVNPVQNRGRN